MQDKGNVFFKPNVFIINNSIVFREPQTVPGQPMHNAIDCGIATANPPGNLQTTTVILIEDGAIVTLSPKHAAVEKAGQVGTFVTQFVFKDLAKGIVFIFKALCNFLVFRLPVNVGL